jgi:hypothetical protein
VAVGGEGVRGGSVRSRHRSQMERGKRTKEESFHREGNELREGEVDGHLFQELLLVVGRGVGVGVGVGVGRVL